MGEIVFWSVAAFAFLLGYHWGWIKGWQERSAELMPRIDQ
jgi:hypothetical protein